MTWTPPARPRWAKRLIAHGRSAGGAESLVSLETDDLYRVAIESTELHDFGGDEWIDHFDTFMDALDEESELHLVGRLLVRTDIIRSLVNRLRLTDLWQRERAILESDVCEPVFIVGSPRTGTSILHELMACDPAVRAPLMWEMQHPVESVTGNDMSEIGDSVVRFAHDLQPEYETMHANSGRLPNECIFITMHEFLSDHWGGQHVVPSYDGYLASADHRPAYRFHKKFLQTLQSKDGPAHWLLKAPSHLPHLGALFDVYPDARIVRTHRDPLKVLPSTLSLLGTLKWMRCENVDLSMAARFLPAAFARTYEKEIADRTSGRLPDDRIIDVRYDDLVRDPVATITGVYARMGREFTEEARAAIDAYARAKPKSAHGAHRYSLEGVGLEREREAERFRFYVEKYGIESEGD